MSVMIKSGPFEAFFSPESGGRLTRLSHREYGEVVVPMAEGPFDPLDWPKAGAFPLFPYHGRLTGAILTHDGRRFELERNPNRYPDAMHGPGQRRRWRVEQKSPHALTMELDYTADQDWPFDFHASQRFAISEERLDVELTLTNRSPSSFPAGIGWHPYFVASLDDTILCDAAKLWVPPTGDLPILEQPRQMTRVPLAHEAITNHLSEWSQATIVAGDKITTLSSGPSLDYLVFHRTAGYACLEPVSHLAGALSLPSHDHAAAGLLILKPGEKMGERLSISIKGKEASNA